MQYDVITRLATVRGSGLPNEHRIRRARFSIVGEIAHTTVIQTPLQSRMHLCHMRATRAVAFPDLHLAEPVPDNGTAQSTMGSNHAVPRTHSPAWYLI